ncbi:MAG: hypothetical protein ACXWC9_07240 [Pseudobdellovibrionaceae bacterium]
MDRVVKVLLAISVSAGVFAACNKNAGGAKVNTPKNDTVRTNKATDKTDPAADKGKVVDDSKMTVQQKAEMSRIAKDVKELRPLFRDAGSLYKEFWPILIKPDSAKEGMNILKLVSWILESNYNVQGKRYVKDGKAECKIGVSDLKSVTTNQYDILFAKCDAKTDFKAIARLVHEGESWSVLFDIGAMDGNTANMMGNLIQIWNAKDAAGAKVESMCKLDRIKKDSGRLASMTCMNIGHDISDSKYLLVKKLEFHNPIASPKQSAPLEIEFSIFEVINGEKPKETKTGTATDEIKLGNFLVELTSVAPEQEASAAVKAKAEEEKARMIKLEEERQAAASQQNGEPTGDTAAADATQIPKAAPITAGVQQMEQADPNQQYDNQGEEQQPPL